MAELYDKTEQFVEESFNKIGKNHSIRHFERTVYWLKQLRPDADQALLISAIAHDIERAFTEKDQIERWNTISFTSMEFLRPHEERGARIITEFLEKEGAGNELIERVKMLVSRHEEGGNEDQNLLKDADSISFFENNALRLSKENVPKVGKEKIREKFDWMYERITSEKAKQIAKQWYEDATAKLESM